MLPRKSGAVLQLLLAGGTYRNPLGEYHSAILAGGTCRASIGLTMIGAMPAVAVRHERRKQEKRFKRPSQLILQSAMNHASSTPSPVQSPPLTRSAASAAAAAVITAGADAPEELYIFGKVSVLHVVVVSLLLGAILVIVGLVQLTPGADASQHRYLLLSCGGTLLATGIIMAALRCCVLPWYIRRRRRGTESPLGVATAAAVSVASAAAANSAPRARSRANSTITLSTSTSNGRARGSVCCPRLQPAYHQRRRSVAEVLDLRREREDSIPETLTPKEDSVSHKALESGTCYHLPDGH